MIITRRSFRYFFMFTAFLGMALSVFPISQANAKAGVSAIAMQHAKAVANQCLDGQWAEQRCLRTVAKSNFDMVVQYADTLHKAGRDDQHELLKENCAAATVHDSSEDFPAYAHKSAYTECANTIADIAEKTGTKPDQSHYQLIVGAVLCLSGDPRCQNIENQMQAYK